MLWAFPWKYKIRHINLKSFGPFCVYLKLCFNINWTNIEHDLSFNKSSLVAKSIILKHFLELWRNLEKLLSASESSKSKYLKSPSLLTFLSMLVKFCSNSQQFLTRLLSNSEVASVKISSPKIEGNQKLW